MHTKNRLPGLPGSALTVSVGVGVVGATALCGHTNLVFGLKLGCDNNNMRVGSANLPQVVKKNMDPFCSSVISILTESVFQHYLSQEDPTIKMINKKNYLDPTVFIFH